MFIKAIGFVLPKNKITLKGRVLSSKKYFENEPSVSYHVASTSDTPSSLAISAVRSVLRQAKIDKNKCRAVVYATSLMKDNQQWSLSASICDALHLKNASFLDIYQGCTGGINALELVDKMAPLCKRGDVAVFATSTLLPRALGEHSTTEKGCMLSDGASALVLSGDSGQYEILATDMRYDASCNEYVKLPYGGTKFAKSGAKVEKWDLVRIKEAFTKGVSEKKTINDFKRIKYGALRGALKKAGLVAGDISFVMHPNYCRLYNEDIITFFKGLDQSRFSMEMGMHVSHTGASDVFIDLALMDKKIKKGEFVALVNDGAGISAGCAILRKC